MFYQWPLFVTGLGYNIANLAGSKRLLTATAAFRNEPFLCHSPLYREQSDEDEIDVIDLAARGAPPQLSLGDCRGVAATEFAVIVPVMLVMFFATVEFSIRRGRRPQGDAGGANAFRPDPARPRSPIPI